MAALEPVFIFGYIFEFYMLISCKFICHRAFCLQEMSYKCGLKYIIAIVAEFDEYSNDVLHAQEGSCLPR